VKNVNSYNPIKVALGEYQGILADLVSPQASLADRLRYLFAPPGYSHDGSRQDSHAIKRSYLADHPEERGTEGLPA
jgi:hypothetical protein